MRNIKQFQRYILNWYRKNNRDHLPWRVTKTRAVNPYEIFVSEMMLQQTQVTRVLEKYARFLEAFPTILYLAKAPLEKVLRVWQGMGYNRRARFLKEAAEIIVKNHKGVIPSEPEILRALPGIGPYTAGAIACFAHNKPVTFLDTNIRKTLLKWFFYTTDYNKLPRQKIDDRELLKIAENVCYKKNPRRWHYALMDYGALVLNNKPELLKRVKSYHRQPRFAGSTRYWRSQIVKYLLQYEQASGEELQALVSGEIQPLLSSLARDGLVEASSPGLYCICR